MPNPVTWFEIASKDLAAAKAFYSKLFGWSMTDSSEIPYMVIDTGSKDGIPGGVAQARERTGVTFYVQVNDPAASLKQAEKLGGRTVMEPLDLASGHTIALFADPEGNVVGLFKPERSAVQKNR